MANQYRSVLASGGASTGGDAVASEVLSGKTFTNDNGLQTGTMPNRGAVSQTLSAGQSYTVPEGYHNGNGVVNASDNFTLTKVADAKYSTSSTFSANIGDIFILTNASTGYTITGATVISSVQNIVTAYNCEGVTIIKATATSVTITPPSQNWVGHVMKLS